MVNIEKVILRRKGFILEGITLGWNAIGVIVLLFAAISAHSVVLGGFGLDSLIEIGASIIVIWELSDTNEYKQKNAQKIIGITFLFLSVYLAIQSSLVLFYRIHPKHSLIGIVWTGITALLMFYLAHGKSRTGHKLKNEVLITEGKVTLVDAILASAVLMGLLLNFLIGWWWADPLAGYVILIYGLKEGLVAIRV